MTSRRGLSDLERSFLLAAPRSLARIATVDADGMPHVVPAGWAYADDANELVLGGRDVPATRRAEHIRASGRAAVVIDGLGEGGGWRPWALLVRGSARVVDDEGVIRVALDHVASWGLENAVGSSHAGDD